MMASKVTQLLKQARHLAAVNDDAEPYKSKYEAADMLKHALGNNVLSPEPLHREAVASIQAVRGLVLLDTDLIADGQKELDAALLVLQGLSTPATLERTTLIHSSLNALGQLWAEREQHSKALEHLEAAQQLYQTLQKSWATGESIPVGDLAGKTEQELKLDLEAQHTHTLLCLAHAYSQSGERDRSALCCAATLGRQLQGGDFLRTDWVQNTLQLSGYFIDANSFALAEYCVLAAQAVAQEGAAVGNPVEEDVAANILMAEGKIYYCRLIASYRQHVEGNRIEFAYPNADSFPDIIRFPSLNLPTPDKLLWGEDALAQDFEGARQLFNKALPLLKHALDFYTLDSWVSEHMPLLMDISNLYRLLAAFEPDSHRRCVMHRQRARLLEGKAEELNPKTYLHFVRSVHLELANIYRSIYEIKELEARPDSKIATAAATASKYYELLIRSYLVNGDWPAKIEAEEEESAFLHSCFNLGRAQRAATGAYKSTGSLQWAIHAMDQAYVYVERNGLQQQFPEAQLTKELAELLRSKMILQCKFQK